VAIGYGSGLPVSFSDGGKVHIGGHVAPVVGGVSMGLITADVSRIPEPLLSLDVPAEIYGRHHSVHQQALAIGVTPNALLVPTARLAGRRVYVHALRDVRPEAETLQS
jgi:alanine racemase